MNMLTDALSGPSLYSVLSMHGVMTWEDDDLTVHCQEVVLPPSAIANEAADCQLPALVERHGVPFSELMDFSMINCLQLAAYAASSKLLMVSLFCRCFQQQCGLAIALITARTCRAVR